MSGHLGAGDRSVNRDPNRTPAGRPRKLTDANLRKILEWKPLAQIARDAGIAPRYAQNLRARPYAHKQPSP